MNKKFIRETLKLVPEFGVVDSHFFEQPVDHIIAGFLCERPPSGAYIWKFAFPLYDRVVDHISLGFGERLPHPEDFIDTSADQELALASEFVLRIKPYRAEVSALKKLENFLSYIERMEVRSFDNPWIRRAYATTLIMVDRMDEARVQLDLLERTEIISRYLNFREDISTLQKDLRRGSGEARATLLAWEAATKQQLKLNA